MQSSIVNVQVMSKYALTTLSILGAVSALRLPRTIPSFPNSTTLSTLTATGTAVSAASTSTSVTLSSKATCLSTTDRDAAIALLENNYCGSSGFPIKTNQHHYKVSGGVVAWVCNDGAGVAYCTSDAYDAAIASASSCSGADTGIFGLSIGWGSANETFCGDTIARCDAFGTDGCQPGQVPAK